MSDKLDQITADLGIAYQAMKANEKVKDDKRTAFFEALQDEFEAPAEKLVEVTAMDEPTARERIEKAYPEWTIDEIRPTAWENGWEAIIKEDAEYMPFTYVNKMDGMVYSKQVSSGSVFLDDERLQQEDPELWLEITDVPHRAWLENVIYHCGVDSQEVAEQLDWYIANLPDGPERVLRTQLHKFESEVLTRIQPYIYYGKPQVKLGPPRKAKEDEL